MEVKEVLTTPQNMFEFNWIVLFQTDTDFAFGFAMFEFDWVELSWVQLCYGTGEVWEG